MHMFGHDNVGPNVEMMFNGSQVDGIDEERLGIIAIEKRPALVAGECQFMGVTWNVESCGVDSVESHNDNCILEDGHRHARGLALPEPGTRRPFQSDWLQSDRPVLLGNLHRCARIPAQELRRQVSLPQPVNFSNLRLRDDI